MSKIIEIIEKPIIGEWGEPDETGNGAPIIRTTNFTDEGKIDYSDIVTRTINKEKMKRKFLRKGDIIIEKSGGAPNKPVGRVVYFEDEENKYLFNNFTSVLRVNNLNCKPKYLFYFMFAKYKKGCTWSFQNKTTGIANLKLERYVNDTEVKLPSIRQQENIVRVFDKTQEIIDGHKKQLEELDNLIRAILYDMFGDLVINEKGWKVAKIKEYFTVKSGSTPNRERSDFWDDGTIPWIKTTEIKENHILECEEFITPKAAEECRLTEIPIGSLLVAMYGQGQTRGRTAKLMIRATTNQACAALIKKRIDVDVDFVWEYLKLSYERLRSLGRGGNQPNLNKGLVEDFDLIIPPIELQNKFAEIVTNIEAQKAVVKQSIAESETLFNSLMSKYFD